MNEKNNKPLLFIDTPMDIKNGNENLSFDSRKNKAKRLHRLEDISAMLMYKIKILVEIKTKNTLYEGVVKSLNDHEIKLQIDDKEAIIKLSEITNINILRL